MQCPRLLLNKTCRFVSSEACSARENCVSSHYNYKPPSGFRWKFWLSAGSYIMASLWSFVRFRGDPVSEMRVRRIFMGFIYGSVCVNCLVSVFGVRWKKCAFAGKSERYETFFLEAMFFFLIRLFIDVKSFRFYTFIMFGYNTSMWKASNHILSKK